MNFGLLGSLVSAVKQFFVNLFFPPPQVNFIINYIFTNTFCKISRNTIYILFEIYIFH